MLNILVADDHAILREGIVNSLSKNFPEAIFKEASTASMIQSMVSAEKFDLVILDINLPGRNGIEVMKDLKELYPQLPIIILSMYPEEQFAVRALKAGASAYLTKETSLSELTMAIKEAIGKRQYITPTIASLMATELRGETAKKNHESLSNREFQVFKLIASGKSITDIALVLSLSVKTISVYRANILLKMNLKNNSEITHYAFKNSLVD